MITHGDDHHAGSGELAGRQQSASTRRARLYRSPLRAWADLPAAFQGHGFLRGRVPHKIPTSPGLQRCLPQETWRESGLGAPDDLDYLKQQNADLEQRMIDLRLQLDERDQDLAAARSANRELMAQLNTAARR